MEIFLYPFPSLKFISAVEEEHESLALAVPALSLAEQHSSLFSREGGGGEAIDIGEREILGTFF